MKHNIALMIAILTGMCASHAALASDRVETSSTFLIKPSNEVNTPSEVTTEDYTQLSASYTLPSFPDDQKKMKSFWSSMLNTLGARKDSREISVGIRVVVGDVVIPEYSIASYKFDSQSRKIVAAASAGKVFPRKRLEAGERITVDVRIRDMAQTQYDLKSIMNIAISMVPSTTVLSELSKPYFSNLTAMGSGLLTSLGSGDTSSSFTVDLSPYTNNRKSIDLELSTSDGKPFGIVNLSLLATPTATREAINVVQFRRNAELGPSEDPSRLGLETNGVRRTYLADIKSIPEFIPITRTGDGSSISTYCNTAREYLLNKAGLTVIDRSSILLQGMEDAGYNHNDIEHAWFKKCFKDHEITALKVASAGKIDPFKATESAKTALTVEALDSFGCWMTQRAGEYCHKNAPAPEATLLSRMHDDIEYFIDSSFMETTTLSDSNAIPKKDFLTAIKGKASSFECYNRGMIIGNSKGDSFRFEGNMNNGKINSISVTVTTAEAANCRRTS